jgi:hypothetical protein
LAFFVTGAVGLGSGCRDLLSLPRAALLRPQFGGADVLQTLGDGDVGVVGQGTHGAGTELPDDVRDEVVGPAVTDRPVVGVESQFDGCGDLAKSTVVIGIGLQPDGAVDDLPAEDGEGDLVDLYGERRNSLGHGASDGLTGGRVRPAC